MNRATYRRKWLRLHNKYEKKANTIFRTAIRKAVTNIPFDNLEENNYRAIIELNIPQDELFNAYLDAYYYIGLDYGTRIGKGIIKEQKSFDLEYFPTVYRNFLRDWLLENAGTRIVSVRKTLVDYLIQTIAKGIEENQDIRTISRELHKLVRSRRFYRWQALRIARTETTAAANLGATKAAEETNLVLVKEWISAVDARTRRKPDDEHDHIQMDGVRVEQKDLFNVQGDFIQFPGDPKGEASNIINCRCTIAMVGKRDSAGRLIFR